jgi:hypothetical protein
LENDANAAVLGFYETRNYGEEKCVTALYMPKSDYPGAAVCLDGKVHHGRDNAVGEVIFLKTAIQWKHFTKNEPDYSGVDIPALIADMILPMIVFCNPDCLVIYSSWLPGHTGEEAKRQLLEIMPREFLPDIVFIPDIVPDFLDGLIHLALEALKPRVDL